MEAIIEQALLAVRDGKTEVIAPGCGSLAGLDEEIRQRAVEGAAPPKTVIGWLLIGADVPAVQ